MESYHISGSVDSICTNLPIKISSFIDAFIDFSVNGGLFLPSQNPEPNPKIGTESHLPSPERLVAVGDLHGDFQKTISSFQIAGIIDESRRWTGKDATVIQIGDMLDRGGDELKILYFLEKLKIEASRFGGSLITMNGNHEIMNVNGDFRYVTPSGLEEFRNWGFWYQIGYSMKNRCESLEKTKNDFDGIPRAFDGVRKEFHEGLRARIAALRPNGPISTRFLARNPTVLVVGDSVFVHGGLLMEHVVYGLQRINEEVCEWIKGSRGRFAPGFLNGRDSVVWLRRYSNESPEKCDCSLLSHVLATIPGARRMIMGHTIQRWGINGVCDNQAIRIDVGLSKGCFDGLPEVLEINKDSEIRVLTSYGRSVRFKQHPDVIKKEGLELILTDQHKSKPLGVNA